MHCSSVQLRAVQFSSVQCSAVQCSLEQLRAVHCSSVQCSAGTIKHSRRQRVEAISDLLQNTMSSLCIQNIPKYVHIHHSATSGQGAVGLCTLISHFTAHHTLHPALRCCLHNTFSSHFVFNIRHENFRLSSVRQALPGF